MTSQRALTGEEDIIQGYLAPLAAAMPGALGLRDDCALAIPTAGCEFVLKTDAIAEGVHFLHDDHAADIGWKALAVNVSDLAAKGARPHGYLLSLAFPAVPTSEWMAAFAGGLAEAQAEFGIGLLGGDTDRRPGPLSITPMVIGEVEIGRMVRRATARSGDIVCVTGTLGDAGLGLALRRTPHLAATWRLAPPQCDVLVRRYLRPAPRLALREALIEHARASMDISDGLLKDLDRMCRAAGIGATIEHRLLPLSPAFQTVAAAAPSAAAQALFAGDDYEILCAIPPERFDAFVAAAAASRTPLTVLGRFRTAPGVDLLAPSGQPMTLPRSGWDHF